MKIDKYFHLYGDKDGVNVHFEEISPPTEKQTDTAEMILEQARKDLKFAVDYAKDNVEKDHYQRALNLLEEKQTNTAELPPKYHKDDLIHRETARRIIDSPRNKEQMLGMLASIPKVETDTAEWIIEDSKSCCSKCHAWFFAGMTTNFAYCPQCGSRMKGE